MEVLKKVEANATKSGDAGDPERCLPADLRNQPIIGKSTLPDRPVTVAAPKHQRQQVVETSTSRQQDTSASSAELGTTAPSRVLVRDADFPLPGAVFMHHAAAHRRPAVACESPSDEKCLSAEACQQTWDF
jgi:hypothetical protein